jgi:hypothetical protein
MFGAGVAAFVWTKVVRRTGQADPKTVWMTAGLAGVVAFVFFITMFKLVLNLN